MATTFQQTFDKENVGASTSVKNRIGLSLKGQQTDNVSLVTPRRVLGNVNREFKSSNKPSSKNVFKTPGAIKVFKENSEKPKAKKALSNISKDEQLSEAKPEKSVSGPLGIFCSTPASQFVAKVDEIEHCHCHSLPKEDEEGLFAGIPDLNVSFEEYLDILSTKKQHQQQHISSHPERQQRWRPASFKRWDIDNEDDEYEEVSLDLSLSTDEISDIREVSFDVSNFYGEPEPMPVPELSLLEVSDDISLLKLSDFSDLPQELEDSI